MIAVVCASISQVGQLLRERLSGVVRDSEEFFVGRREVGPVAGGATLAATQLSAGTLVGTVGVHYATGVSFLLIWVGIWVGWLLSAALIGPQLRAFEGVTLPDFLAARFDAGHDGAVIRAVSALVIVAAYLVYTSAQYLAVARVFEMWLAIPGELVMLVVTVLVLGYVTTGGMRASIRTDVVQLLLLLGGTGLAAVTAVGAVGGPTALVAQLRAVDPSLVGVGMEPTRLVGFVIAFGLGLMAAPNELSRMYTLRDPPTVRRAILVSIGFQAIIAISIAALGLVARLRFPGLVAPDAAAVRLVVSLFGPAVGGLFVLALVAAVLSTVDSVLLVSASALAHDLYARALPAVDLVNRPTDTAVLRASKLATVFAAVVPLVFALFPGPLGDLVQLIVAFYASLIAAALLPELLAGFHWERATPGAALCGTVAGFVVATGWQLLVREGPLLLGLAVVDPVLPGIVANTTVLVGGTLVSTSV